MIRRLIVGVCFLLAVTAAQAVTIDGIRIESQGQRIIVVVDGQQVCKPTNSCFVANLRGSCRVEVYAAGRGDELRRENLLYDERIYCSNREIKEIVIAGSNRPGNNKPGHRPEHFRSDEPAMSQEAFQQFISSYKKQNFESDRKALLDHALMSSYFTTDQCLRLLEFYTFESEKIPFLKKIYPRIADKANFFRALDELTFSSDKEEINKFIKKYHENNN